MYFVDTNIPISYTVIHDKWHEPVNEFLCETEEDIFWSNIVSNEYSDKLGDIIFEVESFINETKHILKNNYKEFINYKEFENFIIWKTRECTLDDFKKIKILEEFWNHFDLNFPSSYDLYLKFDKFYKGFQNVYFKRDQKLNTILKLHDCGVDNYLNYLNFAKKIYEWGVHSPDYKIITDAHDCGIAHDNLVFVSTDGEMLDVLLNNDTSFLNIIEFRSLN